MRIFKAKDKNTRGFKCICKGGDCDDGTRVGVLVLTPNFIAQRVEEFAQHIEGMTHILQVVVNEVYWRMGMASTLAVHTLENAGDTPGFYWEAGPCAVDLLKSLGFTDPRTPAEKDRIKDRDLPFLVLKKDEFDKVLRKKRIDGCQHCSGL